MKYTNFFRWLELVYNVDINKNLQNTLIEYFEDNLNIYTELDLYEYAHKLKIKYYENKYKKY